MVVIVNYLTLFFNYKLTYSIFWVHPFCSTTLLLFSLIKIYYLEWPLSFDIVWVIFVIINIVQN